MLKLVEEQKNSLTKEQWLSRFNLNWTVEKRDLYQQLNSGQAGKIEHKAIVRTDTEQVLNVVTDRYTPIQNDQFYALLSDAENQGLIRGLSGGQFSGGGKTWVQAEFGQPSDINGNDPVNARLLVANSHDGSFSFRTTLSPIRVVCMNTLMAALSHDVRLSFRHTASSKNNLEQLKVALKQLDFSFSKLTEFYNAFARRNLNRSEVQQFFESVLNIKGKPVEAQTDTEIARMTRLIQLFEQGKGAELSKHTAWSAFNAVTEFTSHELDRDPTKRQEKLFFGQGAELNKRAMDTAIALLAG